MARPPSSNRRSIVDTTLTLRLTQRDRELLHELVAMQLDELADTGMEATAASYVRGLIRHEARAKGLLPDDHGQQPVQLHRNHRSQ